MPSDNLCDSGRIKVYCFTISVRSFCVYVQWIFYGTYQYLRNDNNIFFLSMKK